MKVKLPSGKTGKVGVKYLYREKQMELDERCSLVVKEPYATEVRLTLDNGTEYPVGHAEVKGPDKFNRLEGRKWALVSLFKKNEAEGPFGEDFLSYYDREYLFKTLCPRYFGLTRKERKVQVQPEIKTEIRWMTKYKEDWLSWFSALFLGMTIGFMASIVWYEIVVKSILTP